MKASHSFKYEKIVDDFRQKCSTGGYAPGEKLDSERKLAHQYGVTLLTLRRAFGILEDEGLIRRIHGRGTFVDDGAARRQLTRGETQKRILYLGDFEEDFYKQFFIEFSEEARKNSYAVSSLNPFKLDGMADEKQLIEDSLAGAGNVVVQAGCLQKLVGEMGVCVKPDVILNLQGMDAALAKAGVPIISVNWFEAVFMAVSELVRRGHRQIGFIGPVFPLDGETSWHHQLRMEDHWSACYQGYASALTCAGIALDTAKTFYASGKPHEIKTPLTGFLREINGGVTAFVCAADFYAAGLYFAADALGLSIPESFSVIGISNTPWATFLDPELTSVSLNEAAMAQMVIRLLPPYQGESSPIHYLKPQLVWRNSVLDVDY